MLLPKEEQNLKQNNHGGNNKETILLTITTFKKFCLKADTKKADDIHNYYIKLEEVLHETMNEETEELKNQLLIKDEIIKNTEEKNKKNEIHHNINLKLIKHKTLIEKTKGKRCVYISEIEENKFIKIGSTKDTSDRNNQLNRLYGNSIFLEIFECDNFREVEENILSDPIIKKYLHRQPINGHMPQEIILLTDEFNYNQLLTIVKKYVSQIIFLSPIQILKKQKLDLEKQKLDLEKQKLDYNLITNVLNNELYIDTIKQILNNNLPLLIKNNNQEHKLNNLRNSKHSNISSNSSNSGDSLIGNNINIIEPYIDEEVSIDDTRGLEKNETTNPNYNMNLNFKIKGKKPKGQKIQKIDPDNFQKIIEVYDSMVYALRSPENNGFQKSCIQTAIKKNTIYKGFRWNYVKKNDDPNLSKALPTVNFKSKIPIRSTILKINSTKTEIIDSFYTKEFLWKELKIAKKTLRNIIVNNKLYNNHYYIEYSKCPIELLAKYNKPINRVIPAHSKAIKQINPISKEVIIFNTLNEINIKYGFASSTIIDAINNKNVFGGFLWDFN